MGKSDSISAFFSTLATSAKSLVKVAVQSRRPTISRVAAEGERLIVMGNGPSLKRNIDEDMELLMGSRTMAVNFAANADEFFSLKPDYYIIADPHFFDGRSSDPNVERLFDRLNSRVDWNMTLFIPAVRKASDTGIQDQHIKIEKFNLVGVEGFRFMENMVYGSGRGMPRPRNVLIPAIMVGMAMGYKEIFIIGADHTWTRTLEVDDDNNVVSVQPHFYKDNEEEKQRVTSVYRNVRLHDMLLSMHLAFKSYHTIARYARERGVRIVNATPGSFIDAFQRERL